jgi:hypothetical protein
MEITLLTYSIYFLIGNGYVIIKRFDAERRRQ